MLSALTSLTSSVSQSQQSSSIFKNIGITVCENVITKAFSFFTILLLTRFLGTEEYGKYSFIFVMVALISSVFDFGMENTAVRFSSKSKSNVLSIFGLYLLLKMVILMGIIIFLSVSGPYFLKIMHKQDMTPFIPMIMIGLLGESLFFVNDTYLQACQQFKWRAGFNIFRYFSMFLYVILLAWKGHLILNNVLFMYFIPIGFAVFFIRQYVILLTSLIHDPLTSSFLRELFHYEKWMCAYSLAYNLLGRIDFLMLGFWVGYQQLGIYNAAFQICSIVSFLPMALGKVLLPALAELSVEEIHIQVVKMLRYTVVVCVLSLGLIPVLSYLVPILLGHAYVSALPILQILLIAFLVGLLAMPYEQAIYSFGNPKLLSFGRYLQLILIILFNMCFLNAFQGRYGIWIVSLSALCGRLLYLLYVRSFYKTVRLKMALRLTAITSLEACI